MAIGAPALSSLPGSLARPSASNPPALTGVSTVFAASDGEAEALPEFLGPAPAVLCRWVRLYTPVPMAARTSRTTRTIASRLSGRPLRRGGANAPPPAAGVQPPAPG